MTEKTAKQKLEEALAAVETAKIAVLKEDLAAEVAKVEGKEKLEKALAAIRGVLGSKVKDTPAGEEKTEEKRTHTPTELNPEHANFHVIASKVPTDAEITTRELREKLGVYDYIKAKGFKEATYVNKLQEYVDALVKGGVLTVGGSDTRKTYKNTGKEVNVEELTKILNEK